MKSRVSDCRVCMHLIETDQYLTRSRTATTHPCGACYPNFLNYPHTCCWNTLQIAYAAYRNLSISISLFERWFQKNCINYFNENSAFAFSLYHTRMDFKDVTYPTKETRDKAIRAQAATCHELPNMLKTILCPHHKLPHLRVIKNRLIKRVRLHHLECIHKLFPAATMADAKRTNISLQFLIYYLMRKGSIDLMNKVFTCFPLGTPESVITMHTICAMGNPEYERFSQLMMADQACCLSAAQYFAYAKSVGIAARRCSHWVDGFKLNVQQVCHLSYWEMCTGRSGHVSDWEQEKTNRCTDPIYLKDASQEIPCTKDTNEDILSILKQALLVIMRKIIVGNYDESFSRFAGRRQTWCTHGSASGKYLVVHKERIRMDKKAVFESTTAEEMIAWLKRIPAIYAVGSEKNETGKARSIYGTDVESYTILSYLMEGIENKLNNVEGLESGLTGIMNLMAINKRMTESTRWGNHFTMVDYADFNLQHTLDAQYAMFDAMAIVLKEVGAHEDKIAAAVWAANASLNQWARFPGETGYRRIKQGMFSGIRTTDFMNTILNLAYFNTAQRILESHRAPVPTNLHHLHKGDDVWISNGNPTWAAMTYVCMQCMGLEFQDSKQLLSREEGEFLRVRYAKGEMYGYLCRAIGALIERPLQGQDNTIAGEHLQSMCSQLAILHRRGLSQEACSDLWEVMLLQWAHFEDVKGNKITIPRHIFETRHENGGLDIGPPMTYATLGQSSTPMPTVPPPKPTAASILEQHMTNDYIIFLSEFVGGQYNAEAVRQSIHENNTAALVTTLDKRRVIKEHANNMVVWMKVAPSSVSYSRTTEEYKIQMTGKEFDRDTVDYIRRTINTIEYKTVQHEPTIVGDICKAIHSSPFKSLNNAQRAFRTNIVDSAEHCIVMNPQPAVREAGIAALNYIKQTLDPSITAEVLKGLRGYGVAYESELHPEVTSWMHERVIEKCIRLCASKSIKNATGWHDTYNRLRQLVYTSVIKEGTLIKMSKY